MWKVWPSISRRSSEEECSVRVLARARVSAAFKVSYVCYPMCLSHCITGKLLAIKLHVFFEGLEGIRAPAPSCPLFEFLGLSPTTRDGYHGKAEAWKRAGLGAFPVLWLQGSLHFAFHVNHSGSPYPLSIIWLSGSIIRLLFIPVE